MSTTQVSSLWTATIDKPQEQEQKKPFINTDSVSREDAEMAFQKQADDTHIFKQLVEDTFGFFPR